jgi:hypothetical protein
VRPALFLAACVASIPPVIALATAATAVWYWRVYVPRIAGDE